MELLFEIRKPIVNLLIEAWVGWYGAYDPRKLTSNVVTQLSSILNKRYAQKLVTIMG